MAYTDYAFYSKTYGGLLAKDDFERLLKRAQVTLDYLTYGRLWQLEDIEPKKTMAVGMALCTILDKLAQTEHTGGREITLEIVGGHHVAYAPPLKGELVTLRQAVLPFLQHVTIGGVPLCYRGGIGRAANGV